MSSREFRFPLSVFFGSPLQSKLVSFISISVEVTLFLQGSSKRRMRACECCYVKSSCCTFFRDHSQFPCQRHRISVFFKIKQPCSHFLQKHPLSKQYFFMLGMSLLPQVFIFHSLRWVYVNHCKTCQIRLTALKKEATFGNKEGCSFRGNGHCFRKKTWLEAVRASFWEELIFKRCKADYVERKKAFS